MFWSCQAIVHFALVTAHCSLLLGELSVESHLAGCEVVLSPGRVTLLRRKQGHTWSPRNSRTETACFDIRTLRSRILSQSLLEVVNRRNTFASIDTESSFVKPDVRVTPRAVRVVLHCARVNHWGWSIVPSLLRKSRDRISWGWLICFEKSTVVSLHKGVSARAVRPVVSSEGIWLDLGCGDRVSMVSLENTCCRHAVC